MMYGGGTDMSAAVKIARVIPPHAGAYLNAEGHESTCLRGACLRYGGGMMQMQADAFTHCLRAWESVSLIDCLSLREWLVSCDVCLDAAAYDEDGRHWQQSWSAVATTRPTLRPSNCFGHILVFTLYLLLTH
eukprot:6486508-Amphidinium_carterae.2